MVAFQMVQSKSYLWLYLGFFLVTLSCYDLLCCMELGIGVHFSIVIFVDGSFVKQSVSVASVYHQGWQLSWDIWGPGS